MTQPEQLAARLLATFLDELDEQLRTLDEDLLALEQDPGDAERLRSVFRVAHTLKGAARAANVRPIEEVCHALEAMCAGARDSGSPLAGSQIALLFAGSDALADAGRRLRAGDDAGTSPVLADLLQHLRRRGAVTGESGISGRAPASDQGAAGPVAHLRATAGVPRDDQLRVGVRQLDSLLTAAGELLGMTGAIAGRPEDAATLADSVRAWRTEWRRAAGAHRRRLERAGASPALMTALTSIDERLVQLDRQIAQLARAMGDDVRSLGGAATRLVDGVRRLRMRPFADIADQLPRAARDVAATLGKEVQLTVEGQDVEADRTVFDTLRDPLLHLVRNAVDHGIEPAGDRRNQGKPPAGQVIVSARLRGDRLTLTVADDGAGLDVESIRRALSEKGRALPEDDREVARVMFDSGFSTRREATAISGRGVGLDIVRTATERLGGTVDVDWRPGAGTTFTIEAPLSVATLRAMLVVVGEHAFALPMAFVERLMHVSPDTVRTVDGRSVVTTGDLPTPLVSLAGLLGPPLTDPPAGDRLDVVMLSAAGRRLAVAVDDILEEREIVVRPLEHAGARADTHFAGAALLDGTRVALVVNVAALVTSAGRAVSFGIRSVAAPRQWHLLVVDDSITTRTLEESVLSAAGYRVTTAVDGADAWRVVEGGGIDLVVSDVEMPNMDGVALCGRIRASARHATLPIVLVTSLDKPEQRAQGLEAGADAYLMKSSFDQDTLLSIVRQLLGAT